MRKKKKKDIDPHLFPPPQTGSAFRQHFKPHPSAASWCAGVAGPCHNPPVGDIIPDPRRRRSPSSSLADRDVSTLGRVALDPGKGKETLAAKPASEPAPKRAATQNFSPPRGRAKLSTTWPEHVPVWRRRRSAPLGVASQPLSRVFLAPSARLGLTGPGRTAGPEEDQEEDEDRKLQGFNEGQGERRRASCNQVRALFLQVFRSAWAGHSAGLFLLV